MHLVILPSGQARCIYGEEIDLHSIGGLAVSRGSHVESDELGQWRAELSPVGGPMLGPFQQRSESLTAEQAWLEAHWLVRPPAAVVLPSFCRAEVPFRGDFSGLPPMHGRNSAAGVASRTSVSFSVSHTTYSEQA